MYYEGQIYRFIYHVELNWGHLQKDPPGSNANSRNYWKKISEDFDEYSSYFEGDIVKDVDGKMCIRDRSRILCYKRNFKKIN